MNLEISTAQFKSWNSASYQDSDTSPGSQETAKMQSRSPGKQNKADSNHSPTADCLRAVGKSYRIEGKYSAENGGETC